MILSVYRFHLFFYFFPLHYLEKPSEITKINVIWANNFTHRPSPQHYLRKYLIISHIFYQLFFHMIIFLPTYYWSNIQHNDLLLSAIVPERIENVLSFNRSSKIFNSQKSGADGVYSTYNSIISLGLWSWIRIIG